MLALLFSPKMRLLAFAVLALFAVTQAEEASDILIDKYTDKLITDCYKHKYNKDQ